MEFSPFINHNQLPIDRYIDALYNLWKENGNIFLQFLLDAGLDINTLNKFGKTLLSCVVEFGDLQLIELILNRGGDSYILNSNGSSPLHIASHYGYISIVKFLITVGIPANISDNEKKTPLHYASEWENPLVEQNDYKLIVKHLVDNKADMNVVNKEGETPLLAACMNRNKTMVEILIQLGANLNCCDDQQWTIFHYICNEGWQDLIKYYVKGNIDLNAKTATGKTPLLLAAESSHKIVVMSLIELGVDVRVSCDLKMTLLHYSCSKGWLDIVRYLVRRGLDIEVKDFRQRTPLLLAAEKAQEEVVEYLIDCGANLEVCDRFGQRRVLHYASEHGMVAIVESIIKKRCDLNAQNSWGETPLHLAMDSVNLEISACLLEAGADCNLENDKLMTGFSKCIQMCGMYESYWEFLGFFAEKGAYLNTNDYNIVFRTPLLRKYVLQDVNICTQVILNQFNNSDVPKVYKIPLVGKALNSIDVRIASQDVIHEISESVKLEIQSKGYCNLMTIRSPILLSRLCVLALVKSHNI